MFNKSFFPLVIVFLVLAAAILIFRHPLYNYGFSWQVLTGGNLFLYLVTAGSMHFLSKGLHATNTSAFLRYAYGGIMLKLFACAIGAFVYILVAGANLNKPALFTCMGFYMVYTAIELSVVLKQSKALHGKS